MLAGLEQTLLERKGLMLIRLKVVLEDLLLVLAFSSTLPLSELELSIDVVMFLQKQSSFTTQTNHITV